MSIAIERWLYLRYLPASKRTITPHPRPFSPSPLSPSPTSWALRSYAFAFPSATPLSHPTLVAAPRYPPPSPALIPSSCPFLACALRIDGHLAPSLPRHPAPDQARLKRADCSPAPACLKTGKPTRERFKSDVAETPGSMYMDTPPPVSPPPLFLTFVLTIFIDIESLASKGDTTGVERVRTLVYRPESPAPSRASAGSPASFPPTVNGYKSPAAVSMTPGLYPAPTAAAAYPHHPSCALPANYYSFNEFLLTQSYVDVNRIHFKESPFYSILKSLSSVEHCPGMIFFPSLSGRCYT